MPVPAPQSGKRRLQNLTKLEIELIEDIAGFFNDPEGFIRYAFPWGEKGSWLQDATGPDEWQIEVCQAIRKSLLKGGDAQEAIQIAISSGHGIGKTGLLAMLILWFMSTRDFPQGVVTANTSNQLNTKTWRELSKWHKVAINKDWFHWTATKFQHVLYPEVWFAAAVPWTEGNSEAFAGTHEKHVLVIFDEGSAIADKIWEVTEGAMTTPGAMWIVFGNPTQNTGRFAQCFGKFKHRWITRQIDSRTAKMANKVQIQKWIDDEQTNMQQSIDKALAYEGALTDILTKRSQLSVETFKAQVERFRAEVEQDVKHWEAAMKQYEAQMNYMLAGQKMNTEVVRANLSSVLEAAKVGAQVYAQLTSSAYSMIHASAGVSAGASTSVGYSYSNDTATAPPSVTAV